MTGEFDNLRYVIIKADEVADVDFSQVMETAPNTLRYSVDGVDTFVKWQGDAMPSSVAALAWTDGPYRHDLFLELINNDHWVSDPN